MSHYIHGIWACELLHAWMVWAYESCELLHAWMVWAYESCELLHAWYGHMHSTNAHVNILSGS